MDQVAAMHPAGEAVESPLTPDSLGKLGMWMFLAGDALNFGGLLAGYGALRAGTVNWPVPAEVFGIFGFWLVAFMTFLLICSSVTMVLALAAVQEGDQQRFKKFLFLTVLGGLIFLGCQAYEWTHLIHEGVTLSGNPFGAGLFGTTFFILTGFHGLHVTGGVIYLGCLLLRGLNGRYSPENSHPIEIAGLYWHFVDLVWILIFTFVYLL